MEKYIFRKPRGAFIILSMISKYFHSDYRKYLSHMIVWLIIALHKDVKDHYLTMIFT